MGLLVLFASSPSWVGAEGSHIDPEKTIAGNRTALFENMPQHDG
jgi:hypothetical protein